MSSAETYEDSIHSLAAAELAVGTLREYPLDGDVVIDEEIRDISTKATKLFHGRFHTAYAEVNYTREEPHADDLEDAVPMVWANGYLGVMAAYDSPRHATASRGKTGINFEVGRTQRFPQNLNPLHLLKPQLLHGLALHDLIRVLQREQEIEKVDIAGHSFGGFIATEVADHNPDDVRFLYQVAAAGLNGHDLRTMRKRVPYVAADIRRSAPRLRGEQGHLVWQEAKHFWRNPLRTLGEGIVAGTCDSMPAIGRIRQAGVKVGAALFEQDGFFEIESVLRNIDGKIDDISVHPDVSLGHFGPQIDAEGTVEMLLKMRDRMAA